MLWRLTLYFIHREAFWNARTPEMLLEAGSDSRRVLEACDEEIALVKDFVLGHFRKHELRYPLLR